MSFDTVRLIRATLLYDTLAARLDHDIDLTKEYRRYRRDSGKEARKRLVAATERRVNEGLDSQDYLRMEQLLELGRNALVQAERLTTLQTFNFGAYVGKMVSTLVLMVSLAIQLFAVTAAAVVVVLVFGPQQEDGLTGALSTVLHWWPYQLFMAVLVVISIRRILFRLKDREL
jgi:hypothetical protein